MHDEDFFIYIFSFYNFELSLEFDCLTKEQVSN